MVSTLNFRWKSVLCNTQSLLNIVICIKMEVFFSFCIVCRFFKSETSLNYSTFDQQDFVKTQSFNSNDIIVMSYYVISFLTRWKLNKLGMNCKLSKYLLNSFNCKNVSGVGLNAYPPPPQV